MKHMISEASLRRLQVLSSMLYFMVSLETRQPESREEEATLDFLDFLQSEIEAIAREGSEV